MIWQYIGGAVVTGAITLIVLLLNRHWSKKDKAEAKDDEALKVNNTGTVGQISMMTENGPQWSNLT